jgi:hypothetical protein
MSEKGGESEMPITKNEFERLPESSRSLILDIVRNTPGISQEEIRRKASEVFGKPLSQGFAYRWCKILTDEDYIFAKKVGKQNAYYLSDTKKSFAKGKIWYRIEPNQEGKLVVISYTVGNVTQPLKNLPLEKLNDFHEDQMKYEEYF